MSQFKKAFYKWLEDYFKEEGNKEIKSDKLSFYKAQSDDLYNQIESNLSEQNKSILRALEDSYTLEIEESAKLAFIQGFNKYKELL